MKRHNKTARDHRLVQTVLLVSAILLVAALVYTVFFHFTPFNLFLVLVLMACVGICLPGYLPASKKKNGK